MSRTEVFSDRAFDRHRYSSDASHFHLVPAQIATPRTIEDFAEILQMARKNNSSITFRSGGTSLSGQGVTDSILVDTRQHFRGLKVFQDGALIQVEPGVGVRTVNQRLLRFGKKLGPDPASEIACTIGGVIANNSSGMSCGITHNTYRTIKSAVVLLPNGAIIDTAAHNADSQLRKSAPELYAEISAMKSEITNRVDVQDQIRQQYAIKNTMGYGLNSFIDFDSVIDIFLHLLVGSEGTLGFIAEATFETIPHHSHAATALLIFDSLTAATAALGTLVDSEPATIEIMDAASLKAGGISAVSAAHAAPAALLMEYQAATADELAAIVATRAPLLAGLSTITPAQLSTDAMQRELLWKVRKGLYASVAGARRSGTTALLEDISVPVAKLAETCLTLQKLFAKYNYPDAVIFGHAKDGNIHFLINEDFTDPTCVKRYEEFTAEMVELVLAQNGSLKAEHGTGRMMAPFVERQYGPELYGYMKRIKRAFDPQNIFNPGVIITADPHAHITDIKRHPTIHTSVDRCVECGYCEPVCPSKDLTTTPRQRIVLERAIASAEATGDRKLVRELSDDSVYGVTQTCAVDGMCASSCPLHINTGDLVRTHRATSHSKFAQVIWSQAAKRWSTTTRALSILNNGARILPASLLNASSTALRAVVGAESVPLWSRDIPRGGAKRQTRNNTEADFVLFTSCLHSLFESETLSALTSLATKAGLQWRTPEAISELCCGTPWKSKGYNDGHEAMVAKLRPALLAATHHGELPIVVENSSCSEGLIHALSEITDAQLRVIDAVDFVHDTILPRITVSSRVASAVIHPTCSSVKLGSGAHLQALTQQIASNVTVPNDWGCCGFAGDRGFLHPELTEAATRSEAAAIGEADYDLYISTNATCEIGLSRATGKKFEHIIAVLDRMSR